jgi:hypothetical protein
LHGAADQRPDGRLRLPVTQNKQAPGSTRFAFLHDPKTMLGQMLGHGHAVCELR